MNRTIKIILCAGTLTSCCLAGCKEDSPDYVLPVSADSLSVQAKLFWMKPSIDSTLKLIEENRKDKYWKENQIVLFME